MASTLCLERNALQHIVNIKIILWVTILSKERDHGLRLPRNIPGLEAASYQQESGPTHITMQQGRSALTTHSDISSTATLPTQHACST